MKKLIMILMMMVTFVGMATNKPKDNFDYDKYVGYYSIDEPFDPEFPTSSEYEIRKDKKGNYFIIDYSFMRGSGFKYKLPYFKLTPKKGIMYDKHKLPHILKDDKLILVWGDGTKTSYRRSNVKEIKSLLDGEDYKKTKFYDGDRIRY